MNTLLKAILAALPALLDEVPTLIADFEDILNGAKARQASLAQQVVADTQTAYDNLGVLKK